MFQTSESKYPAKNNFTFLASDLLKSIVSWRKAQCYLLKIRFICRKVVGYTHLYTGYTCRGGALIHKSSDSGGVTWPSYAYQQLLSSKFLRWWVVTKAYHIRKRKGLISLYSQNSFSRFLYLWHTHFLRCVMETWNSTKCSEFIRN